MVARMLAAVAARLTLGRRRRRVWLVLPVGLLALCAVAGAATLTPGSWWVRSAVPSMEAYYADHSTYAGATLKILQRAYDRGLKNIRIVTATKHAYCIESTAGSPPGFFKGPAGPVSNGRCPRAASPSAVPAPVAGAPISFGALPKRVVQGQKAHVTVKVRPPGGSCTLAVRYSDGAPQPGLAPQPAVGGQASWSWQVPLTVQAGPAKVTASCGSAGSVSHTIVIVGAKTVPHIDVVRSGFSVRVRTYGGSSVSWGLLLANSSKARDAVGVQVLVNMVDASDHVIGSASQRLAAVPGGATEFPVGNALPFPGAAPVVRLEVVLRVTSWTKASGRMPAVDNVGIAESTYNPGWVGQVQGEIVNDDEELTLARATLNAVVLDAEGNIIGGGQGYTFAPLPSGTREVFTIKSGVDAIQYAKAASALISIQPSWAPAGS